MTRIWVTHIDNLYDMRGFSSKGFFNEFLANQDLHDEWPNGVKDLGFIYDSNNTLRYVALYADHDSVYTLYDEKSDFYLQKGKYRSRREFLEGFENAIKGRIDAKKDYKPKEKGDFQRIDGIDQPLNHILYGPPGTGKTYKTIDLALEIITGKRFNDRSEALELFENLKRRGHIEFVTFHQSYSYEEFVEGIRPEVDDEGNVRYEVRDGTIKRIVSSAKRVNKRDHEVNDIDLEKHDIWKMSLGTKREEYIYEYCIDNDYISLGWGEDRDYSFIRGMDWKTTKETINQKFSNIEYSTFEITAMHAFVNQMKEDDIVLISEGNSNIKAIGKVTGEYEYKMDTEIPHFQFRKVEWLIKDVSIPVSSFQKYQLSMKALYQMNKNVMNLDIIESAIVGDLEENENYVLIIDEINRGNISKIFGELITLIEASKRVGGTDELSATLPYSNELFSIPNNLYIIGTMNTADRSIALIDTALRRRFEFTEVMPDYELIPEGPYNEVNPRKMLKTINERIRALYDDNHQIGHSYLINVKDFKDISRAFRSSIIPLLFEYFHDDLAKVQFILSDHKEPDIERKFLIDSEINIGYEYDDGKKIFDLNPEAFSEPEAFIKIYNGM